MAITLNITLTNQEQAKASEIIDLLVPGKTGAQKASLLEVQAKRLLIEYLKDRAYMHRQMVSSESVMLAKQADEANLATIYTDLDPARSQLEIATPFYVSPPIS